VYELGVAANVEDREKCKENAKNSSKGDYTSHQLFTPSHEMKPIHASKVDHCQHDVEGIIKRVEKKPREIKSAE
jgi:hypothetical protein